MNYFSITLKQVGISLFYIFIGVVLRKTGKLNKSASNVIATLLIYFIAPCYTLINMTESFSLSLLSTYIEMFLIGIMVMVICLCFAFIITRFFAKEGYMKNVYIYLFGFCNLGFFGNPFVEAIFGGEALVKYMIFSMSMNIALSTYGFVILTDTGEEKTKEEKRKHLVKVFATPTIIVLFVSLILCLCSVKLPPLMIDFLTPAKVCYTALPMILLGNVLGGFEIKKLFTSAKAYLVGVIKLIVLPAIFGGISFVARILGADDFTCLLIVLLSAIPPGMNVVTYPESFGIDSSENAKMLFVSYIMTIVTLPVIIMITTKLLGIG